MSADDDLLRRAARSLRDDASEVTPRETANTRARLMATLTVVERRKNRAMFVFVPIAAVLAASLAFAKNGAAVRRAWGWISGDPVGRSQGAPPVERPASPVAPGAATGSTLARPDPDPTPAPPPQTATLPPAPRALAPPTATPSAGASSRKVFAPTAPIASDEAEAAGLALYRTAHRLHFIDHDYAGALAAWDDYLRAEPRGRLAVEVRYNRAIALVHLGRNDEARSALQPFALGQIEGGYRQREASALIDALDSRDP